MTRSWALRRIVEYRSARGGYDMLEVNYGYGHGISNISKIAQSVDILTMTYAAESA